MANKEYYQFWLKSKDLMTKSLEDDARLQDLALKMIGIKPQGVAVELVARVYCQYCSLYNRLCECYDQMTQVQRRPYIRGLVDAVTCRILELKMSFQEVENFEFTYPDNALQQMFMIPSDIQILCPFFYPFEIRQAETQYIIDQIMAGNRIGDPTPSPSEIERREEERIEQERILREEKDAEIKRKLAMGEDIIESEPSVVYSPQELEEMRYRAEFDGHILAIQRMERSRVIIKEKTHKFNKDANLYLELAGLKAPNPREDLKIKATLLIQSIYRKFMELKRDKEKETKLRLKLGMVMSSFIPPSFKINLELVKEDRRNFRRKYYEKWLEENIKENTRVMRLREGDIMEDISAEVRQWFKEWYKSVKLFDEYPWPEEGGSILVVKGETFSTEEYVVWREAEDKRLKAEAASPKGKDEIKAEKLAAKAEKKRLEADERAREKKRIEDYKKSRMNPDNDPGIYVQTGSCLQAVEEAWANYQTLWRDFDSIDPKLNVIRGYIMDIIIENAYQDVQLQLRPIVDEMMKLELVLLKNALKNDCIQAGILKPPQSKKRKKPKKPKKVKPDLYTPAYMFQQLVDEGIIRKYPHVTLDDYWGDRSYATADLRAIPWTPEFPPPCIGDVQEMIRLKCLMTLGSNCANAERCIMLVGPKSSGKKTLVYAIATETNSILIDLSPFNVYNKFPGPKNIKTLYQFVNKVSRLMQPTVILIENVDKTFYKKVPKEEKMFDPTRLQKDFFKEFIKPLTQQDKILIVGTASEPWLSKKAPLQKAFPSLILLPRSDYGSLSYILTKMLMKIHGVDRNFNLNCVAQVVRGYNIRTVTGALTKLLNADRVAKLWHIPLKPDEVLAAILDLENAGFVSDVDYELFQNWYTTYSPWGEKYTYYRSMLDCQYEYKLKKDKKKKEKN